MISLLIIMICIMDSKSPPLDLGIDHLSQNISTNYDNIREVLIVSFLGNIKISQPIAHQNRHDPSTTTQLVPPHLAQVLPHPYLTRILIIATEHQSIAPPEKSPLAHRYSHFLYNFLLGDLVSHLNIIYNT